MYYLVGFIIAIAVGLTGIGGGSFTVPALVLLAGLTAGEAVGTAFLFAGVLRLIAAPFYLLGKQIHSRYLWLLLQGAVPGLLVGTWALRLLNRKSRVRWKEPSLAPVARSADWNGIGIFVRRCWGARNGSSAELF